MPDEVRLVWLPVLNGAGQNVWQVISHGEPEAGRSWIKTRDHEFPVNVPAEISSGQAPEVS